MANLTFKSPLLVVTLVLFGCAQEKTNVEPEPIATLEATPVEPASLSCSHDESRDLLFSSKDKPDTLRIQIIGDECDSATLAISLVTPANAEIYTMSAPAISYTVDGFGINGAASLIANLVTTQSQRNALKHYNYKLSEKDGYFEINTAAVEAYIAGETSLFCHKAGKSFSKCFVFLGGKTVLAYSSGS